MKYTFGHENIFWRHSNIGLGKKVFSCFSKRKTEVTFSPTQYISSGPFLTFIFYFFLAPENSVQNETKKILVKPPRRKKTLRGRYRRLRWFYFNFDYFFLVILIFRYFYYAPQISCEIKKKMRVKLRRCQKMFSGRYRSLTFILYYFSPVATSKYFSISWFNKKKFFGNFAQ